VSGLLDQYRPPDAPIRLPGTGTMGPATMGEAFDAARQSYETLERSDTRDLYAQRIGKTVTDALAARGKTAISTGYGRKIAISPRNLTRDRAVVAERIWQEVAAERARDPEFLKDLPDADAFEAAIIKARKADFDAAQSVTARSSGAGGVLAELAGGVTSSLEDPLTQITLGLTLPIGGPIAGGVARRLAIGALREAALNSAASAPALALKARNAEEIGVDYGWQEGVAELGLQALIGGIFGAGAEGLSIGLDAAMAAPGPRQLAQALRSLPEKTGVPLRQSEEDAVRVLERQADDLDGSPYEPTPEGDAAHLQRIEEATEALVDGRAPLIEGETPDGVVVRPELVEAATKGFDAKPHLEKGRAYVAGGGSLQPAKVAQAMELSEPEADRLLTVLAAEPDSGLFVTKPKWTRDADGVRQLVPGKVRRVPKVNGPEDVLDFLARRGGLRNDEGHALDEIGGLVNHFTPNFGGGPLIRATGMSLEQAQEALQQAGYFGERGLSLSNRQEQIQTSDLLNLLEQADQARQRGKRLYSPFDPKLNEGVARELDAGREADAAARQANRDSMAEAWERDGYPALADSESEALEMAWRRYSDTLPADREPTVDEFLDYHVDSDSFEALQAARADLRGEDFDVPFDDVRGGGYGDDDPAVAGTGARGPDTGLDGPAPVGGRARQGAEGAGDPRDGGADQGEPPAALEAAASDAASGRAIAEFDDPLGPGAAAQADLLWHDLKAAVDPAVADRNRQTAQLGADSPLRPGDRASQADVDGTPLFDAVRSPELFSAPDEADFAARVAEIDAEEAALAALKGCL
jgi:hypothetical protein